MSASVHLTAHYQDVADILTKIKCRKRPVEKPSPQINDVSLRLIALNRKCKEHNIVPVREQLVPILQTKSLQKGQQSETPLSQKLRLLNYLKHYHL